MKKIILVFFIIIGILFAYGWYSKEGDYISSMGKEKFSTWIVYWDLDNGMKAMQNTKDEIKNISYFAAYFNQDYELFIPNNIKNLHVYFEEMEANHFLSLTNDIVYEDGTSLLKDEEILYFLFQGHREKHIENILNICQKYNYDGIEIDYEGLKNNEILWADFLEFLQELWEALDSNNLKMRVVLEPSIDFKKLEFPKGPDYIIMCYNLYGPHSGPGPKANKNFLESIAKNTETNIGEFEYALATGGFNWDGENNIKAILEKEAIEISKKYNITPKRDKESNALYFKYTDDKNIKHEIWYADRETIDYWISILKGKGAKKFSLWRLGS